MSGFSPTFQDIQNNVQNLLKRQTFYSPTGQDISGPTIQQFVNFGLRSIQRFLVVKQATETSQMITIGPTAAPGNLSNHPFPLAELPYPFRYEYDLWANSAGGGITPVAPLKKFYDIREYHIQFPPASLNIPLTTPPGPPQGWVIYDNAINLGPIPDINYTFVLDYVMWLPQLVQPSDWNWYTVNAPDALSYLACAEAAVWLQEDQLLTQYMGLAQQKIKDILKTFREEEVSESGIRGHLLG